MKRIVVDISTDGDVRLETTGFSGPACIEETQFLKDLLGEETARQLTPCYYNRLNMSTKKHLPICG